jgi:hypothetical protein
MWLSDACTWAFAVLVRWTLRAERLFISFPYVVCCYVGTTIRRWDGGDSLCIAMISVISHATETKKSHTDSPELKRKDQSNALSTFAEGNS